MKNAADITRLLLQSGLKKTIFRGELLRVFLQAKTPLSAAQVYEILLSNKKLKGSQFDRATLFRNLRTMVSKDVLSATEFGTGAAYYCLNTDRHHHHHVFCIRCETAKPLESCGVGPMVEQANRMGFKVLNHRLELLGLCPRCTAL